MEIEFNTNRVTKPEAGHPVGRRQAATASSGETPTPNADALAQKLKEIPLVRPEKVEAAKARIANVKYPPEELMEGIANLLAKRLVE